MSAKEPLLCLCTVDRGVPTRRAFFDEGIGPVHLSGAGCTSEDMNLLNCTIDKSVVNGCDHSEDAGVICSGTYKCIYIIGANLSESHINGTAVCE